MIQVEHGPARRRARAALAVFLLALAACGGEPGDRGDSPAPRLVILYVACTVNKAFLSPYEPSVRFTPELGHFAEGAPAFPIHLGGPVGLDPLQVLHRVPGRISGGLEVATGIHVGGDLDDVARYILEDPVHARAHLRLALGYSGWAGGQLEAELALSSWLPAPPDAELVFGGAGPEVWRKVGRSLGRSAGGLAAQPPDPPGD